jgi:MFS family permease
MLLFFFVLVGAAEFPVISLPFLEAKPTVVVIDEANPNLSYTTVINYTICTDYSYKIDQKSNKKTIVYDFEIYCDKTLTTLISISLFFGYVIGGCIAYLFSDSQGRKPTILISQFINIVFLLTLFFIPILPLVYLWLFFSGISQSIVVVIVYAYLSEIIDKVNIALLITTIFSAFAFFGLLYALFFHLMNNWKVVFFIASGINSIGLICIYCYMEESPLFYFTNGNRNMFVITLKKIAKKNNLQITDEDFFFLTQIERSISIRNSLVPGVGIRNHVFNNSNIVFVDNQEKENEAIPREHFNSNSNSQEHNISNEEQVANRINYPSNNNNNALEVLKSKSIASSLKTSLLDKKLLPRPVTKLMKESSVLDLLRYKSQRTNFLILSFLWMSSAMIFYGLTLNIKNIYYGNVYLNSIILFILDIVCAFGIAFISNTQYFGRKRTIILLFLISFISFMICLLTEEQENEEFYSYCLFISRVCCSCILCIIFTVSCEIYPTVLRAKGVGYGIAISRLGAILAPFINENSEPSTLLLVYCLLSFFGTLFVFVLPETFGKRMINQLPEIDGGSDETFETM